MHSAISAPHFSLQDFLFSFWWGMFVNWSSCGDMFHAANSIGPPTESDSGSCHETTVTIINIQLRQGPCYPICNSVCVCVWGCMGSAGHSAASLWYILTLASFLTVHSCSTKWWMKAVPSFLLPRWLSPSPQPALSPMCLSYHQASLLVNKARRPGRALPLSGETNQCWWAGVTIVLCV